MNTWRTLIPSNDPRHLVKGHEIECMKPDGFRSRFMIYAVRVRVPNPDWFPGSMQSSTVADMVYSIRDAERINDADVRAGKRPPVIGTFATLDDALASIAQYRVTDDDEIGCDHCMNDGALTANDVCPRCDAQY